MAYLLKARLRLGGGGDEAGQNREGGLRTRGRADLRGGTCIGKIGRYNAF